jgi:hypothetical protein
MENAKDVPAKELRCGDLAAPSLSPARADLRARSRHLLHAQRDRARHIEETLTRQLQALWEQVEQERAAASQQQSQLAADRDRLQAQLEEAEQQLRKIDFTARAPQEADDLRRRFEIAVKEVRELKAENAELAQQLSAAQSAERPAGPSIAQGFDWESQKQRMLQQLESDGDSSDRQRPQDRLTIEEAIRTTDQAIAEKDKEIAELQAEFKRRLAGQSGTAKDDGAPNVAELLDQDEVIRNERENLRRMQEEWRERVRQSEVETSVERAKIARERVVLEDRIRALEAERAEFMAIRGEENGADKAKSRPRGRWLARLGLKEDDEGTANKGAGKG